MLLKCNTTAVKVRSLLLIWSLKCQRQSSRPPITSAHAGEARSRSVTHHSPSSLPLHAVISSASFPSFLLMLVLHSTRSCFPLVGTWPDQSASTIEKMLLMLIVTAVGLATGSITLHSLRESNRSIWNAAPNHLPSSSSSAFYRHTSSHPPRSTWRVNWLWNCRFCRKHWRVCKKILNLTLIPLQYTTHLH